MLKQRPAFHEKEFKRQATTGSPIEQPKQNNLAGLAEENFGFVDIQTDQNEAEPVIDPKQ